MLRWTVRQCFCKCFKELFHVNFNNLLENYSVLCSCPLTCVSAGSFLLKPSSASASVSNQMITCRFFSVNLVIRLSSCVDCQLCWADVSVEDGCSWQCVWDWTHFTHKLGAILHVRGLLWNLILCDTSKYSLSLFGVVGDRRPRWLSTVPYFGIFCRRKDSLWFQGYVHWRRRKTMLNQSIISMCIGPTVSLSLNQVLMGSGVS